jgi:hypothetical protein
MKELKEVFSLFVVENETQEVVSNYKLNEYPTEDFIKQALMERKELDCYATVNKVYELVDKEVKESDDRLLNNVPAIAVHLIHSESGDWSILVINGIMYHEGHNIDPGELLYLLMDKGSVITEFEEFTVADEIMENITSESLQDIISKKY